MKKILVSLLFLCVSVSTTVAMEWAATGEEVCKGLALELAMQRNTMRLLPCYKNKSDSELNAEIAADIKKQEAARQAEEARQLEKPRVIVLVREAQKTGLESENPTTL